MRHITLNHSNLTVSGICLGTSGFGTDVPEETAFKQMDEFLELGGNFVDTAKVYGDMGPENPSLSERTIGKWLTSRGCRDQVVISTKGGHPIIPHWDESRTLPAELDKDLPESLDHLQTDYIDLYFLHRDNPALPAGVLIDWLEEQRIAGRIHYYGLSNWTTARLKEALEYAKAHDAKGLICTQVQASLATANAEKIAGAGMTALDEEMTAVHTAYGLNLTAYMSMGGGYLHKLIDGRETSWILKNAFENEKNTRIAEWLKGHLNDGLTLGDYNMAFFKTLPMTAVPIASFKDRQQMENAIAALDRDIPEELMKELMALR